MHHALNIEDLSSCCNNIFQSQITYFAEKIPLFEQMFILLFKNT